MRFLIKIVCHEQFNATTIVGRNIIISKLADEVAPKGSASPFIGEGKSKKDRGKGNSIENLQGR